MNGFLEGCGLPGAWADQPQWRILETGFGRGLNFLAAWRAWLDDPQRCRLLHFVAIEPRPVDACNFLPDAADLPELAPLGRALATQWTGLVPGVHRLVFEGGRVLLTLHVRGVKETLRKEAFTVDSLFLDTPEPSDDMAMWDLHTLKAAARHCRRGTRVALGTRVATVHEGLAQCGFSMQPPENEATPASGVFAPAWEPKARRPEMAAAAPGRCTVIGSGLAGAAVAASLARRGWRVTVLDAADAPASGASGVPVGLLAPHRSPDDNLLSRLSRSGVRTTLQQARALLREGEDWKCTGVLEHRVAEPDGGAGPAEAGSAWTRPADPPQKAAALLAEEAPALWHAEGGWIKPAALVVAWLAQPGIVWRGRANVARLAHDDAGWQLLDAQGHELARADLVVVAAALGSAHLLAEPVPLQAVRGQVSWCEQQPAQALPPFAVNGGGHFIPHVPTGTGSAWFCGSTYQRDDLDREPRAVDHMENLARLQALLPAVSQQLSLAFADGTVRAWTGIRCASSNRRPLLGEVRPGLWVSTAMGSRGLTFAALCAEVLAACLHAEPLPIEQKLMQALSTLGHAKAQA